MSSPILFIVGGESLSLEIRETAEAVRGRYAEILNVIADNSECLYSSVSDSKLESLLEISDDIRYIVGFGDLSLKKKFYELFSKYGAKLENIIHPTAIISPTANIGEGNYIGCNVVISTKASLGNCNLINYNVTVGHDVIIGDDCVLNPGCRISGHDTIGSNCLIGANSFLFQGISICDNCKIDALTYIRKSIDQPSICFGSAPLKKYDNKL